MFHSSRAVYNMKDVERESMRLGIISNAVKDVLKELICDDLVHEDKVGVSTYYWSFPGEAGSKKRTELAGLRQQTALLRSQVLGRSVGPCVGTYVAGSSSGSDTACRAGPYTACRATLYN